MAYIREALEEDFDQIWEIFNQIVSAGETFAIQRHTSKKVAHQIWIEQPQKTNVCEKNNNILVYQLVYNYFFIQQKKRQQHARFIF